MKLTRKISLQVSNVKTVRKEYIMPILNLFLKDNNYTDI